MRPGCAARQSVTSCRFQLAGVFKNGFQGGVHVANSAEEAGDLAGKMLGQILVTKQTGDAGKEVKYVLVNEGIDITDELYFAILMDRSVHQGPVIVASTEGGMNIEEVAEKTPEAIVTEPIDIDEGVTLAKAESVAERLNFTGELKEKAAKNIVGLYDLFVKTDATQVEINPLAVTRDGMVYAADAKLNFDDNAAYRQKDLFAMRDIASEDPRDVEAEDAGLNYIGLDGSIGCMVNGAGLAMATMDIIHLFGGSPANFLDVGGGATKEQVTTAFKILVSDSNVKTILVNIFGGIMKCDVIAAGIVAAYQEVGMTMPVVVRLEGTNVEEGKRILSEASIGVIAADDLEQAAQIAVAEAKKAGAA
eukprot:scaffold672_cov268-Pinguiococcus_pyrenoidosus.AAC.2